MSGEKGHHVLSLHSCKLPLICPGGTERRERGLLPRLLGKVYPGWTVAAGPGRTGRVSAGGGEEKGLSAKGTRGAVRVFEGGWENSKYLLKPIVSELDQWVQTYGGGFQYLAKKFGI